MFNRLFSKHSVEEKKSDLTPEYDLRKTPQNEEELKLFVNYVNFVMLTVEKGPVTSSGLQKLLESDDVFKKYGKDFCQYIGNIVKNVKENELEELMTKIAHPFSFVAYKYGSINQDYTLTVDEYTAKCLKLHIEARQLPFLSDLIDIRTRCYDLCLALAENKLKTHEQYADKLMEFAKKIETLEAIKEHYLPPAELVYKISPK